MNMNMKEFEINNKKYLIFKKKEEIKAWKMIIQDYKNDIVDLFLAGAKIEKMNKYKKFIEKHFEDINNLDFEINQLVAEINQLEKTE